MHPCPKKKFLQTALILLTVLTIPVVSFATNRTVTVKWSIQNTAGVTGYKLYYAYHPDMLQKQLACKTNTTDLTTLKCMDVNLTEPPIYFTLAALTPYGEINSLPFAKHSISSSQSLLLLIPQLMNHSKKPEE